MASQTLSSIVGGGGGYSTQEIIDTTGTFTVPDGVYTIYAVATGGGGGGGGGQTHDSITTRGKGGSGGAPGYTSASTLNVTPGEVLTVTIGAGGAGGATSATSVGNDGTVGGTTSISTSIGIDLLMAYGGTEGAGPSNDSQVNSVSNSATSGPSTSGVRAIPDVRFLGGYSGGSGADANISGDATPTTCLTSNWVQSVNNFLSGGRSVLTDLSSGGTAIGSTGSGGGGGGTSWYGKGGDGGDSRLTGATATNKGAGGGGGGGWYGAAGTGAAGGDGGDGRVEIWY